MGEQAIADPLRSKTFRVLHLLASCAHDHLPPPALGGESEGRVRQTPIPSPFSLPDLPVTTSLRPVLRQSMSRNNALPFAGEICMFCPWGTGVNLKLRLLSCLMHLAPAPQYSKRALGYQDWIEVNSDWVLNLFKEGFQQEMYGENWPEKTKDYFKVSNLTLFHKKFNLHLVETHFFLSPC